MNKEIAKELALITAVILNEDLLNGTVFNSFDKAYSIAEEFIGAYPLDTKWGEDGKEYDETIIEFTKLKVF